MKADLTDPRKANALIKGFDIVYHLADIVAGVDFVFSNQPFVFRQVTQRPPHADDTGTAPSAPGSAACR